MTVTQDLVQLLRRVPLFGAMTDAAYERVAAITGRQAVPAGEVVTTEGEEGDAFYVIAGGTADVRQRDRSIGSLGSGDFFGEIALIDGKPRTATVVASEDLVVLRIARHTFMRLIDEQPATRHGVLLALTQRIRRDAPHATD